MNIEDQKFEQIEIVFQDQTGFEDSSKYKNSSLKDLEPTLKGENIKEIHLINKL